MIFVETRYWKRFLKTGKIVDYLYYRGMMTCKEIMERCEGEACVESDYGNWEGADSGADRRI